MSERTTIGGTVYETIGSSSSNLLLKCNGTARIQWGNKLIDLIKNGKIASGEGSMPIFIISNIDELKADGLYVVEDINQSQLWVYKNGKAYNLTGVDLYISASKKLNITAEQKYQALENIGMYYNTLEEVKAANIQNGLVYVVQNQTLYTIQDGIITEFEAKLKTVTVEQEKEQGEIINNSTKIVLSILDNEYIVLENQKIIANYGIYLKNSAGVYSEGATEATGYRLYIDGDTSTLEVDKIKVRDGLPDQEYIETSFDNLISLINLKELIPHKWYLITDYQNPWRLVAHNSRFNRPILLRALTKNSFYKEGMLFKDRRVTIQFDFSYQETISYIKKNDNITQIESCTTRGIITWMKDSNNNEANFDFLDYSDHEGNPLATLHSSIDNFELNASIFPKHSYNNQLIVLDLKGTVIKDATLDYDNSNSVDFQFLDSSEDDFDTNLPTMIMHSNFINCRGIVVSSNCTDFYGNTLSEICKCVINVDKFINNNLSLVYTTKDKSDIDSFETIKDNNIFEDTYFKYSLKSVTMKEYNNSIINADLANCHFNRIIKSEFKNTISNSTFGDVKESITNEPINASNFGDVDKLLVNAKIDSSNFKNIKNSEIKAAISNSTFGNIEESLIDSEITNSIFDDIINCYFYARFNKVTFKTLTACTFNSGDLYNITCHDPINDYTFNKNKLIVLYDPTKIKEVYFKDGELQVICISEKLFTRGMIVMHSGISPIPYGWAPCDGKEYDFDGEKIQTPNLVGRFIKAVGIGSGENIAEHVGESKELDVDKDNKITLTEEHLPEHKHPHKPHTHTISEGSVTVQNSGNLSLTFNQTSRGNLGTETTSVISNIINEGITSDSVDVINDVYEFASSSSQITVTGGDHTHAALFLGEISETTSEEDTQIWENKAFKIEPNYYSLIFIMKL